MRIARGGLVGLLLSAQIVLGAEAARPPADQEVDYAIVVTGRELLEGVYADGHTLFLTKTLRGLGLHCLFSVCVDDRPEDIAEALRYALTKVPLVIVTGGLGPTENDVTRQALSESTGIPLQEHPEILQAMEQRMGVGRDQMRANLRRQSLMPARGTYLRNASGSSAGLVFELDEHVVVALPGPPRELQPMVRDELVPYLGRRFGTRRSVTTLTIRFVGLGQSQIDQTMRQQAPLPPGVLVSSQFEGGRVDFSFTLPGDNDENRARLETLRQQTLACLGDSIYACDDTTTLEQHVVSLLQQRELTLAIAEAGSGGSLAAALDGVDGAERQVLGAFVARTGQQLRRLLGVPDDAWPATAAEQAKQLAASLAAATGSQWALVVGDTQRDERGGSYVELVYRFPDGRLESQRISVRPGDAGRAQLTTQLLDQLRRRLR